ncbi:hypothetical protein YC2023_056937 [Brassica napus]
MRTRDWSCDQSRGIKTNNNLRLATCDMRPIAGRMLRNNKMNNNLRHAISRRSRDRSQSRVLECRHVSRLPKRSTSFNASCRTYLRFSISRIVLFGPFVCSIQPAHRSTTLPEICHNHNIKRSKHTQARNLSNHKSFFLNTIKKQTQKEKNYFGYEQWKRLRKDYRCLLAVVLPAEASTAGGFFSILLRQSNNKHLITIQLTEVAGMERNVGKITARSLLRQASYIERERVNREGGPTRERERIRLERSPEGEQERGGSVREVRLEIESSGVRERGTGERSGVAAKDLK